MTSVVHNHRDWLKVDLDPSKGLLFDSVKTLTPKQQPETETGSSS